MKSHGIAYLNQPGYQGVSWNPITGCTPVGAGCDNCWARSMANRFGWPTEPTFHPERLEEPARWRKPRCVAVAFMGDLFHEDILLGDLTHIHDAMMDASRHRFLLLTKRPSRMADFYTSAYDRDGNTADHGWRYMRPGDSLTHIWPGTSAWDQASADANVPHLLRVPAAVRWLSLEPLLGPVDLRRYLPIECPRMEPYESQAEFLARVAVEDAARLRWVVPGCESGPSRRPCELEWVRSVVEQCAAAGVKCFVKQLDLDGRVSHDPAEWPEDLRVREYPDA